MSGSPPGATARLRRGLMMLAICAAVWAVLLYLTGGFTLDIAGLSIRSRTPRNPALIALVLAAASTTLWRLDPLRNPAHEAQWWRTGAARLVTMGRLQYAPAAVFASLSVGSQIALWLQARPLWLDEEMIALNIRDQPLAGLAGPLWLGQSAPFGWLLLQRASITAFGASELSLRLVPLLLFIGVIAAAWLVGLRWLGVAGMTVLVALCAFAEPMFFNALEVKHYSADAFGALLLIGAAAWAVRRSPPGTHTLRRPMAWWAIAAAAQWFSNGALLAAPGCAVALAALLWTRHGFRSALQFSAGGVIWLASFAVYHQVSLHHTTGSEYLYTYWTPAVPPADASAWDTVRWLYAQARPLARDPGGTALWELLWLFAIAGFLLGGRPGLGLPAAAVTLSAFALAAAGLVPVYGRLSLWIAPALYLGVALACMRAGIMLSSAARRIAWGRGVLAIVVLWIAVQLCIDIAERGASYYVAVRGTSSNHALDDRTAVASLLEDSRPGDIVITTQLGLPAIWWYGGVSLAATGGARLHDGTPIVEVSAGGGASCADGPLARALTGRRRALVYLGFRPDDAARFDAMLLDALQQHGRLVSENRVAATGRVWIIDLTAAGAHEADGVTADARHAASTARDCVVARPAVAW